MRLAAKGATPPFEGATSQLARFMSVCEQNCTALINGGIRFREVQKSGEDGTDGTFLRHQFCQTEALRCQFGRKTALSTTALRPLTGRQPQNKTTDGFDK